MLSSIPRIAVRSINTSATRKSVAATSSNITREVEHHARRMGPSDVVGLVALTAGGAWLGYQAMGEIKDFRRN